MNLSFEIELITNINGITIPLQFHWGGGLLDLGNYKTLCWIEIFAYSFYLLRIIFEHIFRKSKKVTVLNFDSKASKITFYTTQGSLFWFSKTLSNAFLRVGGLLFLSSRFHQISRHVVFINFMTSLFPQLCLNQAFPCFDIWFLSIL